MSPLNLSGLLVNSCGVGWYAYEKFLEGRRKQYQGSPKVLSEGVPLLSMNNSTPMGSSQGEAMTLSRDGSQVRLDTTGCSCRAWSALLSLCGTCGILRAANARPMNACFFTPVQLTLVNPSKAGGEKTKQLSGP